MTDRPGLGHKWPPGMSEYYSAIRDKKIMNILSKNAVATDWIPRDDFAPVSFVNQ